MLYSLYLLSYKIYYRYTMQFKIIKVSTNIDFKNKVYSVNIFEDPRFIKTALLDFYYDIVKVTIWK